MRKIIFLNEKPLYWTCPYCGANLDHGEKCDCDKSRKSRKHKVNNGGNLNENPMYDVGNPREKVFPT
jgi:hypothetical protein